MQPVQVGEDRAEDRKRRRQGQGKRVLSYLEE